jgi:NADH-quinone oxidoreductase E subunit
MIFDLNKHDQEIIKKIINKYPKERSKSAILPILDYIQRKNNGWLCQDSIKIASQILNLPVIYIKEVVSFYSMFFLEPVGKYVIEVCSTLSCMLCGSRDIIKYIEDYLSISMFETTSDGLFTLRKIECLGSCISAPVVKIGDYYYEDLDKESIIYIIDQLKKDGFPKPGSYKGRISSEALTI